MTKTLPIIIISGSIIYLFATRKKENEERTKLTKFLRLSAGVAIAGSILYLVKDSYNNHVVKKKNLKKSAKEAERLKWEKIKENTLKKRDDYLNEDRRKRRMAKYAEEQEKLKKIEEDKNIEIDF